VSAPQIVWFRRDLRLADQAALAAAAARGPVIPVYVLDDETPGERRMGGASRWWLHHSLASLDASLRDAGSRLILRRGRAAETLAALAEETGASSVHALHHYEPWWREAEADLTRRVELCLHHGNYLAPPGTVLTGSGTPYKIYTPFWRALLERMPPPEPQPALSRFAAPEHWPSSDKLEFWKLLPEKPNWAEGFAREWTPGEAGAAERLANFAGQASRYGSTRNLPSQEGTSRLSPHLHFGEISPAAVWHAVSERRGTVSDFLVELGWRDFAQGLIAQFPDYGERPYSLRFARFPWRSGSEVEVDLQAWQQGRTGYPIVDAGMRQLWATGWMHNRVRMIAASFLIKHLLIDWRAGERWFWDALVDADYANNATNWQWSAGSGVDAQMFMRIMAPLAQSPKFDAAGYIRRWVPELAGLDDKAIHDPGAARPASYPEPLIEHRAARERALAAWAASDRDRL
jgi:deoxyribodipyrimidine photo-lyase